jgi:nucleoside-diphosphate-sugar epimerase
VLRLQDGGPILVPSTPNFPLRHVYAGDVVRALLQLIETGAGKGQAFNISQDEVVTLDEFLNILGNVMGREPAIVQIPRATLEANGFLPDCSPFSERWMSEMDNTRGKVELGLDYTPLPTYLETIVNSYAAHDIPDPVSYRRRHSEKSLALQMQQES